MFKGSRVVQGQDFPSLGDFFVSWDVTSTETYRVFTDLVRMPINGRITIDQWQRLFNRAQDEYIMELVGDPAQYQPGRAIASKTAEVSQRVQNALLPFRKTVPITFTDGVGKFQPDDDFMYGPTTFSITGYVNDCKESITVKRRREFDLATDAEWAARTISSIKYPTLKYPIARMLNKEDVQVEPLSVQFAEFVYYRKPSQVYVGRTLQQGRYVLDPADPNNVDPEWFDIDVNQLIFRAASYAGLNLSWDRLMSYSERKVEAGT